MPHGCARRALAKLLAVLDRRWRGGARRRRRGAQCAAGRAARRHRHRHHGAAARRSMRRAAAAGFKAVPTGIDHGTITVVIDGRPFEVTTLREDVETYGRHAKVAFGRDWKARCRAPRLHHERALESRATARCTIMSAGSPTLAARRVRFIGDPAQRIAEDYLRILRFFRFHAAYGARRARSGGARTPASPRAPGSNAVARAGALRTDEAAGGAACGADARGDGGDGLARNRCSAACRCSRASPTWSSSRRRSALAPDPVRRLGALGVMHRRGRGAAARAAAPLQCRA